MGTRASRGVGGLKHLGPYFSPLMFYNHRITYISGFSFAHEKGNVFQWMEYIGCNGARSFMTIGGDWRSTGASQFGKDFSGMTVGSRSAYIDAVQQMSAFGKSGDFFGRLQSQSGFDWKRVLDSMDDDQANDGGLRMGRAGAHSFYLRKLNDLGYNVMGLWDIRCRTLDFKSILDGTEEYWAERWEEYKLFYIGGHWLADHGVDTVELYNEPDRDKVKYGCIDDITFKDVIRIRSAAVRQAYQDKGLDTTIIAGTMTIAWRSDLSTILANNWWNPFPEVENTISRNPDANKEFSDDDGLEEYTYQPEDFDGSYNPEDAGYGLPPAGVSSIGDVYSVHDYGSFSRNSCDKFEEGCRHENGYALAKQRNRAILKLQEKGLGKVPVWITETNCYTASQSDKVGHAYFEGKQVVEKSATAACLASQFSGLYKLGSDQKVPYVNIHKLIQTHHDYMPSGVAKNGVLFANLFTAPHHVGDSSKTGESLRQICKKTLGGNSVYGLSSFDGNNVNEKMNRFNVWTVQKDDNSHIFVINDHWVSTSAAINVASLNSDPSAPYSVTSISDTAPYDSLYHGEVSQVGRIGDGLSVEIGIPEGSFSVITIPSVPVRQDVLIADRDATFDAKYPVNGYESPIRVITNGRDTSVGMFNFNLEGRNTVGAVLELHLERATNRAPQVLQVLGWDRAWEQSYPSWSQASLFTKVNGQTREVKDNFINWDDPEVTVVGHITVPPGDKIPVGGMKLRVDVSDTIGKVSNYAVLRPVRYDASRVNTASKLPSDIIEGEYFFTSIEGSDENKPKLLVNVRV